MSVLTGDHSPVFIPRLALTQMSDDEVIKLCRTYDSYPDRSIVKRTTREWACSINDLDGKEFAKCDVVSGGADQPLYLVFPPKSGSAALAALEQYRKLINPYL
jgi:hypothetical protein